MIYRDFSIKLFIIVLLLFSGKANSQVPEIALKHFEKGNFKLARITIENEQKNNSDFQFTKETEIFLATMERIQLDFPKTEKQITSELKVYFPNISAKQLRTWEKEKKLEMKLINGERKYFRNAVPNLFRLDSVANLKKIKHEGLSVDPLDEFCLNHTKNIIESSKGKLNSEDISQKYRIEFSMKLKPGILTEDETVRCWMPYPRQSLPRQKNIKLTSGNFTVSNNSFHSSLYGEKKVNADNPTEFNYTAEFETTAQWFNIQPNDVQSYNLNSELYTKYTEERPPHIIFSEEIKNLAKEITNGIENPLEKVKAIYYWIDANIPWASALEYSIMESIPEYVLENRKGDCGMQSLLFMSLARFSGIPCKWQSGWMLHPGEVNLHDWCEVYYEGIGWVPLDQSFGLQDSDIPEIKEFYITGIDAYRLIINDDFGSEFDPPKQYYRSEPVDFQRGEMEGKNGNLYFDKWNYNMNVTYLNLK